MEISDQLLCLFSGRIERQNGSYVITVPTQELEVGALEEGATYRVSVHQGIDDDGDDEPPSPEQVTQTETEPRQRPPVSEGETRTVEIENIGDQGDGITRVERGFVVIVPDTEQGERVGVEITDVRENVAFATVVKRYNYYE